MRLFSHLVRYLVRDPGRFVARHLCALAAAVVDLVLPEACVGCGRASRALCEACVAPLLRPAMPARPVPAPSNLPPSFAVAAYEGSTRACVIAYKEQARTALAHPLGAALAEAVDAACPSGPVTLVPVPSTRRATRLRGHDAVRGLALRAAAELRARGRPARVLPVLRHRRQVADQTGLSIAGRAANLAGALGVPLRLAPALRGPRVVVVDDVMTTGATLSEAVRAIAAAGGHALAVATVATTPRRHDGP